MLTGVGPLTGDPLVRFRREAELASKLDHPNLCTVYDTGIDREIPYIAMQYVDGETVSSLVARAKKEGRKSVVLTPPKQGTSPNEGTSGIFIAAPQASSRRDIMAVVHLVEKCARALQSSHEAGIVHRDIKPANIMVSPSGEPVILDFGVARDLDSEFHTLTQSGELFGSPAYMAPEQLSGKRIKIDRRTDVYALGVTLYECLTLRRPFEAPTLEAICQAITTRDPPDPRVFNAMIPGDLKVVIETALEKDRDRRYRSAGALADELRRIREYRPIKARPPTASVRVERWIQRNPIITSFTLTLLLVLGVALTVSLLLLKRMNTEKNLKDQALIEARRHLIEKEAVLGELERLADVKRVRDLDAWDDRLWPVHPDQVTGPKGMDAWIDEAETLYGRLALHETSLKHLRQKSMAGTPLTRTTGESTGEFHDAHDAWRHENLVELVARIRDLPPRIQAVRARREQALTLERRSIQDHRAAWDATIEAVASDPRYRNLPMTPQLGLVPLGRDPKSGLFEFSHLQSGEVCQRGPDGRLRVTAGSGVVLVLLPGGTFAMGATREPPPGARITLNLDPGAAADEGPVQNVAIDPFFLSKYEMTQGQWYRFTGRNPSYWVPGKRPGGQLVTLQHPVEQVSWNDGCETLRRLGLGLPTEAQWEYACRAGTTTPWSTGNTPASLTAHANLADEGSGRFFSRDVRYEEGLRDGYVGHAPVGTYRPNSFGLHDMHGNVWEWCRDGYGPYADNAPGAVDGLRSVPGARFKVYRGGGFYDASHLVRSSVRGHDAPAYRDLNLGLRPMRPLEERK